MRLLLDGNLNPLGNRKLHRMRESKRENDVLAFYFSAISDSDDVEIFLEAGGDAKNRVGHQRSRQSVQRPLIVAFPKRREDPILRFKTDAVRHPDRHLSLRSLHVHRLRLDLHFHARGHRYRFISNSRHGSLFPKISC